MVLAEPTTWKTVDWVFTSIIVDIRAEHGRIYARTNAPSAADWGRQTALGVHITSDYHLNPSIGINFGLPGRPPA